MSRIAAAGIDAAAAMGVAGLNYDAQMATNRSNERQTASVNTANRELAMWQNQWNVDQWRRENEYNHPVAQALRLRNAGMSDAAALQAIEGAGNASQLTSADLANQVVGAPAVAPQLDPSAFQIGHSVVGLMREIEALRKEKHDANMAQTDDDSHRDFVLTDLDEKRVALDAAKQKLKFDVEAFPHSLRALRNQAKASDFLPEIQRYVKEEHKLTFKTAKENYAFTLSFNTEKLNEIRATINKIIAEADKARQEKIESESRTKLNNAQTENTMASTEKVKEETNNLKKTGEGIDLDNAGKKIQNVLAKYGAPSSDAARVGALVADGLLSPLQVPAYLKAVRRYVVSGGAIFDGTPDLRAVFINDLNPGIGEDYKLGQGIRGLLRNSQRSSQNFSPLGPLFDGSLFK